MKVRYIRDYLNGSTSNTGNHWIEIQALDSSEVNKALNKAVSSSHALSNASLITDGNSATDPYANGTVGVLQWVKVDLGAVYDINKIKVWHYHSNFRTYHNTKLEVSEDNVNWKVIFDSASQGEYRETPFGKEFYLPQSFGEIRDIFGITGAVSFSDLYRGGLYIPDITQNIQVPESSQISLSNFLGVAKQWASAWQTSKSTTTVWQTSKSTTTAWQTSKSTTTTWQVSRKTSRKTYWNTTWTTMISPQGGSRNTSTRTSRTTYWYTKWNTSKNTTTTWGVSKSTTTSWDVSKSTTTAWNTYGIFG